MRILSLLCLLFSLSAWCQDPMAYLGLFDNKVYSLKTKGVKDFSVDISSDRLLKIVNEQMNMGVVKALTFRVFWTAQPERLDIEVIGLPDGFREVKEELKLNIFGLMENLLPLPIKKNFENYKLSTGSKAKEYIFTDSSGMGPVPSYTLTFDQQDRLTEIKANKFVGTLVITPSYEKTPFSDGKWVIKKSVTVNSENGQTLTSTKTFLYGDSQGIGVLSALSLVNEQTWGKSKKPLQSSEKLEFKNYKIDAGVAQKHFIGVKK